MVVLAINSDRSDDKASSFGLDRWRGHVLAILVAYF
jgi:hypothetical protein